MLQGTLTVALNLEKFKKRPAKIIKIKPFIDKYSWKGINFPSEKDDSKKMEKNNLTIALNDFYAKSEKICFKT